MVQGTRRAGMQSVLTRRKMTYDPSALPEHRSWGRGLPEAPSLPSGPSPISAGSQVTLIPKA